MMTDNKAHDLLQKLLQPEGPTCLVIKAKLQPIGDVDRFNPRFSRNWACALRCAAKRQHDREGMHRCLSGDAWRTRLKAFVWQDQTRRSYTLIWRACLMSFARRTTQYSLTETRRRLTPKSLTTRKSAQASQKVTASRQTTSWTG